jgi:aspartate--ammonia ligase
MNAIRRDEELDNIHSIYVDQWDWEKIIDRPDRTLDYLKETVRAIVHAICAVNEQLQDAYPQLRTKLRDKVTFITSQELEDLYPDLTPEMREHEFTKIHKTVFVMQIGEKLKSGKPHGNRAPDYDDWALNGDLLFWNDILGRSLELSSMGIRVDAEALDRQLRVAGADARRKFTFHQMLLSDLLPLTIGGGIGQSRLCMLMMECAHIGEVQSSVWDRDTIEYCERRGIPLL